MCPICARPFARREEYPLTAVPGGRVRSQAVHTAIVKIVVPKASDALGADPDMPDAVFKTISRAGAI